MTEMALTRRTTKGFQSVMVLAAFAIVNRPPPHITYSHWARVVVLFFLSLLSIKKRFISVNINQFIFSFFKIECGLCAI
jgi:hypothetical protein